MNYCKKNTPLLFIVLFVLVNVSACSSIDNFLDTSADTSGLDYKNNRAVKSLSFPPDLTAPEFDMAFALPANGTVSASAVATQSNAYTLDGRRIKVLPKSTNVRVGSIGSSRWLDVNMPAEALWSKVRDFWRAAGVPIKRDEPRIGLMETEWVINRAGLPLNWFSKAVGKVLGSGYDAATRDKFRIRMEKPTANTSRIYLTHKGAEKIVLDTNSGWELRPANHEIEAEMINRLKAFLQGDVVGGVQGSGEGNALQAASLASLVEQEGSIILQVHDNYKRSWVLTGIMLDRMGLVAEKRNQAAGIYDVRYQGSDEDTDERGFFKKLFGGKKTILIKGEDYQVHVQDTGKLSVVRIMDEEGKPLSKRQAQLALTRLKQEFDR